MASKIKTANSNTQHLPYVLSVDDMSYTQSIKDLSFSIPSKLTSIHIDDETDKTKLTLVNAMRNALINKDNDSFTWCLKQTDLTLVTITVKSMDGDMLSLFLSKVVELFQSNNISKKNLLMWMKEIMKYQKYKLLSMDHGTIENLNRIKNAIENYVKYIDLFKKVSNTMKYIDEKVKKGSEEEDNNDGPLLVYAESDDEEETKKKEEKKRKMKEKGIEEVEEEEDEEIEVDNEVEESEEDMFDESEDEDKEEEAMEVEKKEEDNDDMEEDED